MPGPDLVPGGAACSFNYTTGSPPSLVLGEMDGAVAGLVKLSGDLVRIEQTAPGELGTEGLTIRLGPAGGGRRRWKASGRNRSRRP
ncbi:hypothetical protein GE300_13455 [Rhodobacteraceae bacterium 2CG4]|uniref:Uncharacterized protein n=1 Tax=Halovulum marinum TaxID=2662447 RepID=A0A6L5Z2V7_9RHOB|nr:hypothetical protein [Halovulum marinum]MSU90609.1 hypothetical protein [Halovulum marinum]